MCGPQSALWPGTVFHPGFRVGLKPGSTNDGPRLGGAPLAKFVEWTMELWSHAVMMTLSLAKLIHHRLMFFVRAST